MKLNDIKLTESQLAELFQNNSKKYVSKSDASDCLAASAASSNRLNHLEDLINDHTTAHALKISLGMKDWSQVMSESIENSRQSWFSFLGMSSPLKTAFATLSFAFVFAVAMPNFNLLNNQEPVHAAPHSVVAHDDIISINKFDSKQDRLSKGSFDESSNNKPTQDALFDSSFG